ncbi:MAG: arsenate reductase ArsC [Pseudomonadota bacterium]
MPQNLNRIQIAQDPVSAKYGVLVLCTGNSARSVMAEALFNCAGMWFHAYSAGSHPVGRVNPFALEQIETLGLDPESFRSKDWFEFTEEQTPSLDFVITVCDNAASERCPDFPDAPQRIHWSFPDPAATTGTHDQVRSAFNRCFDALKTRVETLSSLPLNTMDKYQIADAMRQLGNQPMDHF